MRTINLYGVDGINIHLDKYNDIVAGDDPSAIVKVIGYTLYASSLEEAQQSIRREYLALEIAMRKA